MMMVASPSIATRERTPMRVAVDFFNQVNLLFGSITEFCTNESCPVMTAGPRYEYYWADGEKIKKPIKCTAPEYVEYLMDWIQSTLDDETIFPARVGMSSSSSSIHDMAFLLLLPSAH
mgnify:CR=1 FL=1